MNLLSLSKNAVSYSSPSTMKCFPCPARAPHPKLLGMPPMRKPGESPADSITHASSDVGVVLPFVQRPFHLRVAAFHGVANDDQIGMRVEIRFAIPAEDANAMGFEKCGHR